MMEGMGVSGGFLMSDYKCLGLPGGKRANSEEVEIAAYYVQY